MVRVYHARVAFDWGRQPRRRFLPQSSNCLRCLNQFLNVLERSGRAYVRQLTTTPSGMKEIAARNDAHLLILFRSSANCVRLSGLSKSTSGDFAICSPMVALPEGRFKAILTYAKLFVDEGGKEV